MAKTTIEFSDIANTQLDRLADTLHTTKAEVMRNALSLYAYIVYQLHQQPDRLLGIVNEKQGNRVEMLLAVPGVQLKIDEPAHRTVTGQS
jgi:predicted transcriptional regulator